MNKYINTENLPSPNLFGIQHCLYLYKTKKVDCLRRWELSLSRPLFTKIHKKCFVFSTMFLMNKRMEKYRKVVSVNLSKVHVYNTAGIEPIGFKDQRIIPSWNWPYSCKWPTFSLIILLLGNKHVSFPIELIYLRNS